MEREVFENLRDIRAALRDLVLNAEMMIDRIQKVEKWVSIIQYEQLDDWDGEVGNLY